MSSTFILLSFIPILFFLLTPQCTAQPAAPAPSPSGSVNLTGILVKGGQYNTFVKLLYDTQVIIQLDNQINTSTEGFSVFAPTDNAFQNLEAGTLNDLSAQQKVQLVLYHITPKYYTLSDLLTVSNPVRTQATGNDGGVFGLNFTGQGNQVNVSTGVVETPVNNALRQQFPLAVYQVDKVLLPVELFGAKSPGSAPSPSKSPSGGSNSTTHEHEEAGAPSPSQEKDGAAGRHGGFSLAAGLGLILMGLLS